MFSFLCYSTLHCLEELHKFNWTVCAVSTDHGPTPGPVADFMSESRPGGQKTSVMDSNFVNRLT